MQLREKHGAYIPYANDPTDKKLAEFLTDKDERLKVYIYNYDVQFLLIREQEGIYLFGTKKIFMKIENDKLLVKTGGGFMKAESYFDITTID